MTPRAPEASGSLHELWTCSKHSVVEEGLISSYLMMKKYSVTNCTPSIEWLHSTTAHVVYKEASGKNNHTFAQGYAITLSSCWDCVRVSAHRRLSAKESENKGEVRNLGGKNEGGINIRELSRDVMRTVSDKILRRIVHTAHCICCSFNSNLFLKPGGLPT